ncbi:hypothetical protein Droror1_Dr00014901 [Drosera rotundifolia]
MGDHLANELDYMDEQDDAEAVVDYADEDNLAIEDGYPVYNLVMGMLWRHPENIELEKVKVVHYCAAVSKPWRYTRKEQNMDRDDIKMLIKKWREIYHDSSLDYKPEEERKKAEAVKRKPLRSALKNVGAFTYVTAPSAA